MITIELSPKEESQIFDIARQQGKKIGWGKRPNLRISDRSRGFTGSRATNEKLRPGTGCFFGKTD